MFLTYTYRYKIICALLIQTSIAMQASIIIQGDSSVPTESFTHPIKKYTVGVGGQLYVAANENGAKNFAIASTVAQGEKFKPLTPEKVLLDNTESATNPLFGTQINHMTIMYGVNNDSTTGKSFDRVAAVTQAEPSTIYLIDSIGNSIDMLAAHDLKDASGTCTARSIVTITSGNYDCIYAAVTDSKNNNFGEGNSGIAIVARHQTKVEDNKSTLAKLVQFDPDQTSTKPSKLIRAARLNNQSSMLRIRNSTLSILNNAVDMHWSNNLKNLYTSLHINAQGNNEEGGQAIAVGMWCQDAIKTADDKTFVRSAFILRGIAAPSAFTFGVNNIVGSIGQNVTVSIHQIKTILTSTILNYLVILGGVGLPDQTKRSVYALPLVKRADLYNGMLAKKDAVPHTYYHEGRPARIAERAFVYPAIKPGDLFTADDTTVQVGHGQMTEGDITFIMSYNDAVYAVVSKTDSDHTPGIFHSQALFDSLGRIKEWTYWRRVSGNFVDNIFGAILNQDTGNITMFTGNTEDDVHTVKRTTWDAQSENGSKNLVDWFNSIFPNSNGGIQGLFDMPVCTPGLNNISLLIATGLHQIAITQTGLQENGLFKPIAGQNLAHNPVTFTNGAIDKTLPDSTNAITLSGGVLDELQVIKAATITRVDNAGYIFVGSTHGLAVLINDQGCSFDARVGLGNNLSGLVAGTTCKKIGTYSDIRKLVCDDEQGFLYIVSDSTLERIDIRASDFNAGHVESATLASLDGTILGSNDTILDAVASRSLCIIATSNGLWRNGPRSDIRTAQSSADIKWQRINLPEGFNCAKQIFYITQTGREQDLTTGVGGNIYILNTNQGKHKAIIYRFTVNTQSQDHYYQYLIEEFPDFFIKDLHSYFVQLPRYRTWIYTDGSLFFQEHDKNNSDEPLLTLLPASVRSGLRFGGNSQTIIPLNLQDTSIIQPIVRSSASGSWLLARNNILSVNE